MKHTPDLIQPQLTFDEVHPDFITLRGRAIDLTGKTFGRLTTLGPVSKRNKRIMWLCLCECGNKVAIRSDHLLSNETLSCGCLRNERTTAAKTTHGFSGTHPYGRWVQIINRCTNPSLKSYARYGGRGITICDEWRHDFQAFHDYVSKLPHYGEKGYTLDRIDNDGNYEPGNLRWATQTEQGRNKHNNRMITYNGETKSLAQWSQDMGIRQSILRGRIRHKWPVEKMFTQAVRRW